MHTLIPLTLIAIIIWSAWPYIKQGFDIVPDNSDYPIDGHTALKSALAVWKAKRQIKRDERAQKRELRRYLRARWKVARRETVRELEVSK